ncbi:uncharacterized protein [Arachis hypogaea]|uniref:uncharacterized protein n=1 Tax=Arachis hypogaea TaxID=3818 RepID=UPI003B228416
MEKMMKPQELANKNHEASLRNLERQIGHLSKQPERPTNTFPSDTIPNPKEECKAIQLSSGRTLEDDKVGSKKEVAIEEKDQEELKKKDEEPQASKKGKQVMEDHPQGQRKEVKPYISPLPYPQRLQKELKDQQFSKFLEVFKKMEINIPLAEALEQMPLYAKFLKELINKKRSWNEKDTVVLTQECSVVIQKGLSPKLKDPRSFIISCTIGNMTLEKSLCDLGASINLMPLSLMKKLAIDKVKPIRMSLQIDDKLLKIPNGVVENLLVKVGEFIFPTDFVILDMEEEGHNSIILGRPFLAIARAIIDVEKGEMTLRVHDEKIIINVFKAMKYPSEKEKHMRVEMIEKFEEELLEANDLEEQEEKTKVEQDFMEEGVAEISFEGKTEEVSKQELKPLPPHLKYAFVGGEETLPVIINSSLNMEEETKLIEVLKAHKTALGWTIDDIKGISPTICMHKIFLEEDSMPVVQPQRRLNPTMKEVVQKEVMKLWNAGIIYPISDSLWDAKRRLIRWVLLLQEFDIKVRDRKESKNQVADHLSRLPQEANQDTPQPVNEKFPDEHLLQVQQASWFAEIANYKVGRKIPQEFTKQQVKMLHNEAKKFLWDEPFLFKRCPDGMIRRSIPESEMRNILWHCHESAYGGHFGLERTAAKVLQSRFYWPTIFKDAREFVNQCNE